MDDTNNDENIHTIKSTTQFAALESFATWFREDFEQLCIERCGRDVTTTYILPYRDDMLESIVSHIQDLGDQSVDDEEYMDSFNRHNDNTT